MNEDLRDLLMLWWGSEIPDDRAGDLVAKLSRDAEFRRDFVAEIRMLGMLRAVQSAEPRWLKLEDQIGWSAMEPQTSEPLDDEPETLLVIQPRVRLKSRPAMALAASVTIFVILAGAVVWLGIRPRSNAPRPQPVGTVPQIAARVAPDAGARTESEDTLAMVVALENVRWDPGAGEAPTEGSPLGRGHLRFQSGRVLVSLLTRVELLIEGPADVEFVSLDQVRCHHGKLWARVPKGSEGFIVAGPGALVVDLGTEFGLNVEAEGKSRGTVFKGEVEAALVDPGGNLVRSQLIEERESFEIDPRAGRIVPIGRASGFVTPPQPDPRSLILDADYAATVLESQPWGYWRFERVRDGAFLNEIAGHPPLVMNGPVHQSTDGPPDNHCAVFDRGRSYHDLSLRELWEPTRTPGFAVELWFATDVIDRAALVSLLSPEGTDHHLLLLETTYRQRPDWGHPPGKLRFLHRWPTGTHGGENLFSDDYYVPYRWHHVVAQIDHGSMYLFMDGKAMPSIRLDPGYATTPCQLLLGSLAKTGGRPFVGRLDEVAVYDHPLRPEEVLKHYHSARQEGRPREHANEPAR